MGIPLGCARLLVREAGRQMFTGSIATLGRQRIFLTPKLLRKIISEGQCESLRRHAHVQWNEKQQVNQDSKSHVGDTEFFKALGFDAVESLDYSDYENASHLLDLNSDATPDNLIGRYDCVFDGGTIEHVFNIPATFKHIFRLLNIGGRVIHLSPSSNFIDHGFYSLSPTLFLDFYTANEWRIDSFYVLRHTPLHSTSPWLVSKYTPGCLDRVSFGGLDDGMFGVFFVATKTAKSRCDRVPQQNLFARAWEETKEGRVDNGTTTLMKVFNSLEAFPRVQRLLFWLNRTFRQRPGLRLPVDFTV
jgi:hypothetical protein